MSAMNRKLESLILESRIILDVMQNAVCVKDISGRTLYSNQAYEKMIRRSSTELVAEGQDICVDNVPIGKVVVYHDISDINRLKRELDRVNQKLRKAQTKYTFKDIIGQSSSMLHVIETAKVASMTPATIMLRGESGTGKEIFANAIHNNSPRRNEKFVKINCSSLPEELLESELFGYKEGAFTGALRGGRKGLFQEADKGTLFLDEVGDVSPRMQVKLLRALQEKEIMPVGAVEPVKVDVRIICATNKPLEKMIAEESFREDLYYRLNVFPLHIPPLRERKEDIPYIVAYLLQQYNEFYGRNVESVSKEAVMLLQQEDWNGNVRELENVLSRAFINLEPTVACLEAEAIEQALLGEYRLPRKREHAARVQGAQDAQRVQGAQGVQGVPNGEVSVNLHDAVAETEQRCIEQALKACEGDKNKAAVMLGLPVRTLYYKCKKYGI